MINRNGNYAAFYVKEPFFPSNLGPNSTRDFVFYNMLRAWKGQDSTFPFNDSHDKNYNVRDGSDWEKTLKPRLRERLSLSKNIVLFLSSITTESRALREEMDYGIGHCGLPVIVVYPEFTEKNQIIDCGRKEVRRAVKALWNNIPSFRDRIAEVPTLHVPNTKDLIRKALNEPGFMVATKKKPTINFYPC